MEYIAITIIAIALTIFFVYKIGNCLFGLELKIKPLILCAFCALFISIVLPRIVVGFAGLAGTVAFLAVFAVVFAYFVAYYDETAQDTSLTVSPTAATLPLGGVSEKTTDMISSGINSLSGSGSEPVGADAMVSVTVEEAGNEMPDTNIVEETLDVLANDTRTLPIAVEQAWLPEMEPSAADIEPVEAKAAVAVTTEEPLTDAVNADITEVAEAAVAEAEILILPPSATEQALQAEPTIAAVMPVADNELVEEEAAVAIVLEETVADECNVNMVENAVETAQETVSLLIAAEQIVQIQDYQQTKGEEFLLPDTLDELLELAFLFKEEENISDALRCFRTALQKFPESEAAPFLVVEIANILKNKGQYDDAIKIFTDGRSLPSLNDSSLSKEYTETIAYLRIVKNILLERRLGFIPYNKIPADVCRDIDAEFREWRNFA